MPYSSTFGQNGAFTPLGSLPRRGPVAKFHFNDQESSPSDDDDDDLPPPKLKLTVTPPSASPRPKPSRTISTPILLSNGKPLKSSLKSSSSPNINNLDVRYAHLRSASAPSSPNPDKRARAASTSSSTPKNVHFPSDLEDIRLFNASAKPLSVSSPRFLDDTETETEGEAISGYPFPSISHSTSSRSHSTSWRYDFSPETSPIPNPHNDPYANVMLESIRLSPSAHVPMNDKPNNGTTLSHSAEDIYITGTVRLRNLSYEKFVHIRFTLDKWATTSEVTAKYLKSLPAIHTSEPMYDIFSFSISLPVPALVSKTLWMVVRYNAPGSGEWWDNNSGHDYHIGFTRELASSTTVSTRDAGNSATGPLRVPQRPARMERSLSEGDSRAAPHPLYGYAPGQNPVFATGSSVGYGYTPSSSSFSFIPSPFSGPNASGSFATGSIPSAHSRTNSSASDSKEREEQHAAVQNATEKRLRGFSLSNYARPTAPAPVPKTILPSAPSASNSSSSNSMPSMAPAEKDSLITTKAAPKGENSVVFPRSNSSSDEEAETPDRSLQPKSPATSNGRNIPLPVADLNIPLPEATLDSPWHSSSQDSTPKAEIKTSPDVDRVATSTAIDTAKDQGRTSDARMKINTKNLPVPGLHSVLRHTHHEPHLTDSPLLVPLSPTEPSDLVRSVGALEFEDEKKTIQMPSSFIPSRESSASSISLEDSPSLGDSTSLSLDDLAPWIRLPSSASGSSGSEAETPSVLPALDRSRSSSTSTSEESEFENLFTTPRVFRRRAHPTSISTRGAFKGPAPSIIRPPTPPPSMKRRLSDEVKEPSVSDGLSKAQQALRAFGVDPSPSPPEPVKARTSSPGSAMLSPLPLSPASLTQPHPLDPGTSVDSNSLYNAFVRQWCFATTPPIAGTPGAMTGSGAPTPAGPR